MPTAWLWHRSALVWVLFFPWFPALPPSPPEAKPPAAAAEAGVAGESQTAARAPEELLVLPGVVIEEIPKGSALEKAGLQVGDVILSWERLANPPSNPEAAQGELTSYFDWLELEVEQVPRGAVVLRGRRGGAPLELRVEPGLWEARVRPVLSRASEEIYLAGKAQLSSGDIETAVRTWRSLAEGSGSGGGGDLRAWFARRLGEAWGDRVESEKAVSWFRVACDAAGSPVAKFASWAALGDALQGQSKYDAAKEAYIHALELSRHLHPESLMVALGQNNLGFVEWTRGELRHAYDYLLQALQLREKLAPQSLVVANSLNNLGVVARELGQLADAEKFALEAFRLQERVASQSLDMAASLNNLGLISRSRGYLEHATNYFERAIQLYEKLAEESLATTTSLSNLGHVALDRGEMDRANDYYIRALYIQKRLVPGSLEVARSLNNLGSVARRRGDLDLARDYFGEALIIQEHFAPQSLNTAAILHNLGGVSFDRGQLDSAQRYYSSALQIREELAPESLEVASSLQSLGLLARVREDLDLARSYSGRAVALIEQFAPQSLSMAQNLRNLAIVARTRGDLDIAYQYYTQALEAFEHHVSKLGGSYNVVAGFRAQRGEYYRETLDLLLTQDRFIDAFHLAERFRAQTFLIMLAERDTAFTADIPEELDRGRRRLGVQYDRTLKKLAGLNPQNNREEIEATRRELRKLEAEAGDIEERIRQASPRLAALKYPHPLDTAEARQALDPGTLLISYSVGKEKIALFALSRSGELEVKMLPFGEVALRSQVKQLLSLIREAVQGSSLGELRQQRVQAASRELYVSLLGPVAERIAASERLLILPDGPLHALPFAALVREGGADAMPGGGQYLGEWKPLHIALSATVFAELKQRRHPASESNAPQAPIQLAAFGDPLYPQSLTKAKGDSAAALPATAGPNTLGDAPRGDPIVRSAVERGVFDWQPLPYTRHEVEGIARLFPAEMARTFLGPEALEDRIKSLDPKTRILHLAAHGYTDEHLPSSSFVALTIPEDTNPDAAGTNRENGLLQVWEIFERVRLDADLVVLSACDTGLGEEQGGEGLIGLTRAFQYAGARTVMASLWSVQDQATSELMIRFYKHLRAGLSKDEALRQAQIALIRGPIEVVNEKGEKTLLDASAPYYWAGFQIYGDWQ